MKDLPSNEHLPLIDVVIALVLLVVPIQMGLERCFDMASAALDRRRARREKRRKRKAVRAEARPRRRR